MKTLTHERLKAVLHYDPATGIFTWLVRQGKRSRGDIAGCQLAKRSGAFYWAIQVDGQLYQNAGRLAWLYVTGELPKQQIDHKNGNPLDNRWANLRLATPSQNQANKGMRRDNRSGLKGVVFVTQRRKWQANISVNGRNKNLGRFKTREEAAAAYAMAAIAFQGEFARPT